VVLKHSQNLRLPDIKRIKDPEIRKIFEQLTRAVFDSEKNIYDDLKKLDDSDNVEASAVITDNAIVRGDGGARGVQDATPTISDAGIISTVTDPVAAQDAATKASSEAAAAAASKWEVDGGDTEMKTADDMDMQNMQIKGVRLENRTDDTGCTQTGRIWFRTDV